MTGWGCLRPPMSIRTPGTGATVPASWMGEHGRAMTASPREVYFADVMAAAPQDEVCHVAFPIR